MTHLAATTPPARRAPHAKVERGLAAGRFPVPGDTKSRRMASADMTVFENRRPVSRRDENILATHPLSATIVPISCSWVPVRTTDRGITPNKWSGR